MQKGEFMTLLEKDVKMASEVLTEHASSTIRCLTSAVGGSVASYRLSPVLFGTSICVVPVVGIGAMTLASIKKKLSNKRRETETTLVSFVIERMSRITTIRLNDREDYEKETFKGFTTPCLATARAMHSANGKFMGFLNIATNASLLAVLYVGGSLITKGDLTGGGLTEFLYRSGFIGLGFAGLSNAYSDMKLGLEAAARVFKVIDRQRSSSNETLIPTASTNKLVPLRSFRDLASEANAAQRSAPSETGPGSKKNSVTDLILGGPDEVISQTPLSSPYVNVESPSARGLSSNGSDEDAPSSAVTDATDDAGMAVSFQDVCFSYPSRPNVKVLRSLTASVPACSITAIVGGSGSGKSTLMGLLAGLRQPTSGKLVLHGHEVTSGSIAWIRRQVGAVEQDAGLLSGTIKSNIAYGKVDATHEDVVRAAIEANAHSFIKSLPLGFDTPVGEGGSLLSGGQRARVGKPTTALMSLIGHINDDCVSHYYFAATRVGCALSFSVCRYSYSYSYSSPHYILCVRSAS
jgi:ABC-type multidrug transport system fused ATPase/permease subunit